MPETSSPVSRSAADRCPGVLRLAEAADGLLARVRLPGGLVSAEQLRALARIADELGDGRVELTSRGNVQVRGLAADAAPRLTAELAAAGLLPSLSHDQVRNVLASPLAGLDRGPDLTGLIRALDAELCARPRLAELSGRFLFAVDDGRGDVAGLGADVVATIRADGAVVNGLAVRAARPPGAVGAAAAGDVNTTHEDVDAGDPGVGDPGVGDRGVPDQGVRVADHGVGGRGVADDLRDAVVTAMLEFAEAFLDLRAGFGGTAWRVADLPDGAGRVRAAAAVRLGLRADQRPDSAPGLNEAWADAAPSADQKADSATAGRPVGIVARKAGVAGGESAAIVRDDDALSVVLLAPLGRLTAARLTWIADRLTGRPARVTPWRSVVLPHVDDAAGVLRAAAALGFGTDESSPWLRVTACAGKPGCARALADVQRDAAGFAARWPGRIVHVSGCERHCGRPAATEIDVTATSEGYQVAGI